MDKWHIGGGFYDLKKSNISISKLEQQGQLIIIIIIIIIINRKGKIVSYLCKKKKNTQHNTQNKSIKKKRPKFKQYETWKFIK